MGEVIDWRGSAAFHPATFIQDEMTARNWTPARMASAMAASVAGDYGISRLMLDMYLECGPTDDNLRMGPEMVAELSGATGISREYFQSMESAWLKARGVAA